MNTFQKSARAFNTLFVRLLDAPVVGGLLGRSTLVLAYTGRRSGKAFSLPVSFARRSDTELRVRVALPDQKNWWRNFTGDGAPVTVTIRGVEHRGHAVTTRTDGKVTVAITLDQPPTPGAGQ